MTTIDDCRLIPFRKITAPEGSITPIEGGETIPFEIERVFYLYDVPVDASRGGHAHKRLEQVVICMMGSFDFIVDDGRNKQTYTLRRADQGLYIPAFIWGSLINFSSGAVCLTLASMTYDESEYVRDYDDFLQLRRAMQST